MTTNDTDDEELNLLVVDWDFFFPNPMQGGTTLDLGPMESLLYDWKHSESAFYIDSVWDVRASGFLHAGLPLPRCAGYEGFWDRFTFAWEQSVPFLLYGDSNLHAGRIRPSTLAFEAEAWTTVSLWDAHHDSGYRGTLEEWRATNTVACDTWMLLHHDLGSHLEVIYPSWRTGEGEAGPLIPVERRVDDGTNPDRVYHAVYLCRSGAWVPPWCDDQFAEFLDAWPGEAQEAPGNEWVQPRPDVMEHATLLNSLRADLEKANAQHWKNVP